MLYSHLLTVLALVACAWAQAHGSPGNVQFLVRSSMGKLSRSPAPAPAAPPTPPPPPPAAPAPAPPATKKPAFEPVPRPSHNPVVSLVQSDIRNTLFTLAPPRPRPGPTRAAPSFALSNMSFGSTLVPKPSPTPLPSPPPFPLPHPDSTPGRALFCTSTTYTSWAGDSADATCAVENGAWERCVALSEAVAGRVVSARPDRGQVCFLYGEAGCGGEGEAVKWPGVQNLRGRIAEKGERAWAGRVVSFRCGGIEV